MWLRADYELMVRAVRARCLPRDRGAPETVRHDISQQLPNNYPTTTRTTTRRWQFCYWRGLPHKRPPLQTMVFVDHQTRVVVRVVVAILKNKSFILLRIYQQLPEQLPEQLPGQLPGRRPVRG